jgi:glycosyltransferase involved in cell wall biosynthesis
MPSRYECFGMVAAEAMARGVATIVSENSGVAELVDRRGGAITAPPTVEGIGDALQHLDRERDVITRLAESSAAAVRGELSLEAHGERIRHQYERVLVETGR